MLVWPEHSVRQNMCCLTSRNTGGEADEELFWQLFTTFLCLHFSPTPPLETLVISLLGFREGRIAASSIKETQILFFTRREVKLKMSPVGNTQKGCKMLQNKWKAIALKLIYRNKYAGQVSSQPVNPVTVPAIELSCLIGWKTFDDCSTQPMSLFVVM